MSKFNPKYSEEDEEYAENNDYQYGDSREEPNDITTTDLSMRLPVKLHISKLEVKNFKARLSKFIFLFVKEDLRKKEMY